MKNTTVRNTPGGFHWNIQIPYPRTKRTWGLIALALVGLFVLTYGMAKVFPNDEIDSAQTDAPVVDIPALEWRDMIAVLTRYGEMDVGESETVSLDALLVTPQYLAATRREAPGDAANIPSIVFYLTETTHIDDLPSTPPEPVLKIGDRTLEIDEMLVMADSPHHRAIMVRYDADGIEAASSLSLVMSTGNVTEADGALFEWELPLPYSDEYASADIVIGDRTGAVYAPAVSGVAVLAVMGGLLAAMWPCLFQLTAYFIPAMAGMSMQQAAKATGLRPQMGVVKIAVFFVLGFTIVYTLAGAVIGYGSQRLSNLESFYIWQRYLSMGAGVLLIGMALRVAAKARAPLVCKMPILRKSAGNGATSPWESMLVGIAFATGCMTCFGSAILIGMVLYVGLAGSPLVGATLLLLFSLGMGVPLVIGAMAMARVLPLLFRLEKVVPWMGLASATLIAGYGIILMTGNFMTISGWFYRLMGIASPLS